MRNSLRGIRRPNFQVFASQRAHSMEDVTASVFEVKNSIEDFKARHNSRLDKIETELKSQDGQLAEFAVKLAVSRRFQSDDSGISSYDREVFCDYARKGIAAGVMQTQDNPGGGWFVPSTVDENILLIARNFSPMRQYATVLQGGINYSKLVLTSGSSTGWVTETGTRPQLNGPNLAKITPPVGELYTMPAVTQTLLDTSSFDIANVLSTDIARQFAIQEGTSFVKGTGVNQPRGIATHNMVDDANWSWGNVGFIKTGDANGFPVAPNAADCLIKLVYSVLPQYRAQAVFGMNKNTISIVRQFKDSTGRYLWQDSIAPGQPPTLLGYAVVEFPDVDDVAAGKFPIMFGDLSAYVINDVSPTSVLRDPFSVKPFVLFYTTKRIGGALVDFQAIKFLKVAA